MAGKLLGDVHAFAERDVSQTRRVDAVADGVDAGRRRLELLVDLHETALIDGHACGVEAGVFRHRAAPDGDEQHLGVDRLRLPIQRDRRAHAVVRHRRVLELGTDEALDAALAELLGDLFAEVRVFERQHGRQHLDDGDRRAERRPDACELDADRSGAEDDRAARYAGDERLIGRDDAFADLHAGDHLRLRARCDDEVLRGDLSPVDRHGRRAPQGARAAHDLDLLVLDERLEAFEHLRDDLVLVALDPGPVERAALRADAERARLSDRVEDLGGMKERLGGDAAAVQACSADQVAFDECDFQPQARASDGGRIAAGSGSEDDQIEFVGHAGLPRFAPDANPTHGAR